MAFSTTDVIETCFKKATGLLDIDLSEHQLIDYAYGCEGAYTDVYLKWIMENPEISLVAEDLYPYLEDKPKLSCPAGLPQPREILARVTNYSISYVANEDILKAAVFKHGAVISSITWTHELEDYTEGIFTGCEPGQETDHSVTVVGYGSENGTDYWLVKNSWGTEWGLEGYMKLQRGVHMCGVGKELAFVECEAVDPEYYNDNIDKDYNKYDSNADEGFTHNDKDHENRCQDFSVNCEKFAKSYCQSSQSFSESCQKYCHLC